MKKVAADLTAKDRKKLPTESFGIPEERRFPMPDASHVRLAWAMRHRAKNVKNIAALENRIKARAKELGVELKDKA
jgi:hypothetical protein